MFTKEKILEQLHTFTAAQGKSVIVHTSMRAVGKVEDGAEGLLDALIHYFTKNGGHLFVPTHTWDSMVYDRRKVETCLGALPMVAAAHPDGVRSMHPTHSTVVFGEKAAEYARLDDHTDTPVHPEGCLGSIIKESGYILLIGVGQDKNTCIHCVEEILSVKNRLTKEKVVRFIVHHDGREEVRKLYWFDEDTIPDVSVFFPKLEPAFRYHGCILDGRIGNADVQLVNANKMKRTMEGIYKNVGGTEIMADSTPLPKSVYTSFRI